MQFAMMIVKISNNLKRKNKTHLVLDQQLSAVSL